MKSNVLQFKIPRRIDRLSHSDKMKIYNYIHSGGDTAAMIRGLAQLFNLSVDEIIQIYNENC